MCIRGFPLYGYLMTVSTPTCAYYIARWNNAASSKIVRFFSRHYGGETSNSSVLWASIGSRPHVYQGSPPILVLYDSLHPMFCIFYRPLWNVPLRIKRFQFLVGTMRVNHQNHWHSESRSRSGSMFITGSSLYGYLWLSTPLGSQILSPVVKCSASSKMVWLFSRHYVDESSKSSALRGSFGIRPHVYQGFPPRWLFNDSLHPLFCIFYRPLLNIPRRVKWVDFSVGTMEEKHQTHQYSDG